MFLFFCFCFFNDTATTEIYTLSLHDALPICSDGSLPGRFRCDWTGAVEWSCLTGCAQLATVLLRTSNHLGDHDLDRAARRILAFVKTTQNLETSNEGLRGRIKGSVPFDGDYGKYQTLNWATKFFVDGLLLAEGCHDVEPSSVR